MQLDKAVFRSTAFLSGLRHRSVSKSLLRRLADGKMRATSLSWDGEKVLFTSEVLEIRNVDSRLHVARKVKRPDECDPLIAPMRRTRPSTP
jgi:hypothetical protein